MANRHAPPYTRPQNQNKAWEILESLSDLRIDSKEIKIVEIGLRAKGGQSTVIQVPGTMLLGDHTPPCLFHGMPLNLAIKMYKWDREDAEASEKFFKSFVNELSIIERLSPHPNIVMLMGFVEDMEKGDAWIITPWEANGNVREFLQAGEWDIPERLSLVKDVINGVEYLHTRQPPICHGDLKSLNILVNPSYRAVITDFGSARTQPSVDRTKVDILRKPSPQTANGDTARELSSPKIELNSSNLELTLTGPAFSLRWTAPEVLNNGVQALPSDMWAIGWVCWEIFTGKIPFEELTFQGAIISHVIKEKLPAIREELGLSHTLELCSLMSDCWVSNPAERIDAPTFRKRVGFMPSTSPSGNTSGGAKVRSAVLLKELGTMYLLLENTAMAESHYQSARDLATRTTNNTAKADALVGLGETHLVQSRYRLAEKVFREAHEIFSHVGNDLGVANALGGLGEAYCFQSRYQEGEQAYKEARETHSRIPHDLGVANASIGLGRIYSFQTRYVEAEKAFTEAYEIHSRISDNLGVANALDGLGEIYRSRYKYQEAQEAFIEAHEIHSRIGNFGGAANTLNSLGVTYRLQSKNQEAEHAFVEAHEIHSRIGNDLGTANALDGLGEVYSDHSKNEEAERAFMEAHEIYSRIGHDLGAANSLLGLGHTYHAQSRYQEAEQAMREAHNINSDIGNHLGVGNTLRSLAILYSEHCKHDKAEVFYHHAAVSYDRADSTGSRATALFGLAQECYVQSKYPEAEEAAAEALAIWISMDHDEGQAKASKLLTQIFRSQSRDEKERSG